MTDYNKISTEDKIPITWNSNDVFEVDIYLSDNPYDPTSKPHYIVENLTTVNNENTYIWDVSIDNIDKMGSSTTPPIRLIYLVIAKANNSKILPENRETSSDNSKILANNSEILDVSLPFGLFWVTDLKNLE